MRTNVSTKTFWVTLFTCLACQANAQETKQLEAGKDNELKKNNVYLFPQQDGVKSEDIYYLPDFFEKTEGQGYKFLGKDGSYAIKIKEMNQDNGIGKSYYMEIFPVVENATGEDRYASLENNFGAIWVSGEGAGLPNYQYYTGRWDAKDIFAMAETDSKRYEMTLTLGKELGPETKVKFWFHNFNQSCYHDDRGGAQYGKPNADGTFTDAGHVYEFRGNAWNGDNYMPLLKIVDCDFLEVSQHVAADDHGGNQFNNGNLKGVTIEKYSDLPKLPISTSTHIYKYKFTINLEGVNDIMNEHKGEEGFAYSINVENKGEDYKLQDYKVNTYDDLFLDTEDAGNKHAIPLRDAMRFQGGVLYEDHFEKKFNTLAIKGYLNKEQDIYFLKDIGKNIKILDLSKVTTIEGNNIPDDFCANSNDLEKVILPASLQSIGKRAFSNCPNLKEVILSETLQTIDAEAFSKCNNLKEINLPKSLQTIGANAFSECKNLEKVYVTGNNAATGAHTDAFKGIIANQCELVFGTDSQGDLYRNGGWMNILTKDIYENAKRETDKNYDVCHQAHADVILHRQFTGKWETIVLPFDVDKKQIRTKEGSIDHASYFYGYQGNATSGNISFVNVHHVSTEDQEYTFKAGSPFLLRFINDYISPANDSLTFENVETYASPKAQSITKNGLTFVGTFDATPLDKDKLADIFALKEGKFVHAKNATMKGYRAWFEKASTTQSAKALTFTEVDGNNTTAIIGIGNDGSLTEAFDIYNINGQLVQKNTTSTDGLPKGIYIVNHKKIVVK